jgi:mannose-6-phosphate isomerase-like protein (cupin superfamily)
MARWAVRELQDIPTVPTEPDGPGWHPLQHYFGLSAFGANVFVARRDDQTLVEVHDEGSSGQEELYLVLEGEVAFELDGERIVATRGTAVAVPEPGVRRRAVARTAGTALLALGAQPGSFETTWRASHFRDVPRS